MQMAQAQQPYWNSFPGGNVITTNEWLGADYGSLIPLRIQTRANQPIDFSTADRLRAHINESTSYPIGVAPTDARNGYMLLSGQPDFWNTQKGPFTRLHLVDDVGGVAPIVYAQNIGFRNWMRNGITFTGNSDQAYIGQKYKGSDNTDFVIQWSTAPSSFQLL